jgi:hypothetical protein
VVNATSSAKKLRGFFLRRATLNPVTHDYNYLAYAPVAGEAVRIEARVYNYSTGKPCTGLDVLFQAVEYDATSDTEIGPRLDLGTVHVPTLAPLGMTPVAFTWDTTDFGPAQP